MINSKHILLKNFSSYLLIAILIIVSNDTLFFGTNSIHFFQALPRYGSILLCVYLFFKPRIRFFSPWYYLFFLCLFVPYVLSSLLRESTFTLFGIYFFYILVGYFVATRIDFKNFVSCFENVIFVLCVFSIIGEIIAYLLPGLLQIVPKVYNVSDYPFAKLLFCNINIGVNDSVFIRNGGIFWEPGVFQIYINIALMMDLFYLKRTSVRRVLVYTLALLFTFSTSGYICFFLVLLLYAFQSKKNVASKGSSFIIKTMVVFFLFLSVCILFSSQTIYNQIFGKLGDFQNGSFLARFNSIVADYYMAKSSPFIGVGMAKVDELTTYYARTILGVYAGSNSNGVFYQFAAYGIIFGFVYLLGLISFVRNFKLTKMSTIILSLIFLLLFFGERLQSWFPYIFMFYGLEFLTVKKEEKSNERIICQRV